MKADLKTELAEIRRMLDDAGLTPDEVALVADAASDVGDTIRARLRPCAPPGRYLLLKEATLACLLKMLQQRRAGGNTQ